MFLSCPRMRIDVDYIHRWLLESVACPRSAKIKKYNLQVNRNFVVGKCISLTVLSQHHYLDFWRYFLPSHPFRIRTFFLDRPVALLLDALVPVFFTKTGYLACRTKPTVKPSNQAGMIFKFLASALNTNLCASRSINVPWKYFSLIISISN